MADLTRPNASALPSLDKARELLSAAETVRDVQKIKALAQAVANVETGEAAREHAHRIVLLAKARLGEITAAMPKVPPKESGRAGGKSDTKGASRAEVPSKRDSLAAEGVSEKEAAEAEKLAKLKASGQLDAVIDAAKSHTPVGAVVRLASMSEETREKAIAKLGEHGDIKRALADVKLDEKNTLADQIRAEPPPPAVGPFRVITIDPPWRYDSRVEDASHRGRNPYPDMSIDELAALPVASLSHDDAVLWLWTTNTFMREAYTLLDAWGFKAKTILTWDKQSMGLGDWLRNVTEHCIVAVRGRPVVTLTNQTTLISERRREHSRKPDAFYRMVETLCPGNKLEMFSREPRDGWTRWGAETEKFNGGEAA